MLKILVKESCVESKGKLINNMEDRSVLRAKYKLSHERDNSCGSTVAGVSEEKQSPMMGQILFKSSLHANAPSSDRY